MTKSPANHTFQKRGFTSISRWMPGLKLRAPLPPSSQGAQTSRPYERFSQPNEDPLNSAPSIPSDIGNTPQQEAKNQDFPHPRHRYLVAREAIAIGILTTLFLLTSITCEITARSNSLALYVLIPFATFLALHLICAIAAQLANIAKPLIGTNRDLAQGVIILTLFSGYAVLRVVHPIADWFTPIAWVWIAIMAVDIIGRIIEKITTKTPTI